MQIAPLFFNWSWKDEDIFQVYERKIAPWKLIVYSLSLVELCSVPSSDVTSSEKFVSLGDELSLVLSL